MSSNPRTPLVRERSRVQSSVAAPPSPSETAASPKSIRQVSEEQTENLRFGSGDRLGTPVPGAFSGREFLKPTTLYRHFDAKGRLLYVGISLSVLRRLAQHRTVSRWFSQIASVTCERFPDQYSARRAEAAAIRAEKPRFNILGSPTRPQALRKNSEPPITLIEHEAAKAALIAKCAGQFIPSVPKHAFDSPARRQLRLEGRL